MALPGSLRTIIPSGNTSWCWLRTLSQRYRVPGARTGVVIGCVIDSVWRRTPQ